MNPPPPTRVNESFKLPHINSRLQKEGKALDDDTRVALWKRWLWEVDLKEAYCNDILVNEAHLIGLLLCRDMGLHQGLSALDLIPSAIPSIPPTLILGPSERFCDMSVSAVVQSIESLQMGLTRALYADDDDVEPPPGMWVAVERLTLLLFHRLGFLCLYNSTDTAVFDHLPSIEVIHDNMLGINIQTIRRLMDIFVILFRHIDIQKRSKEPPATQDTAAIVQETMLPHAIEATKDEFYNVSMHFELPPGARLSYIHCFPGMYNCVSQVVFYNNEAYERRAHNEHMESVDVLPMLLHMYPSIPFVLEEETPPVKADVYWFLLSGRVYLMVRGVPLFHRDIFLTFLGRHDYTQCPPLPLPPCPAESVLLRTYSRGRLQ